MQRNLRNGCATCIIGVAQLRGCLQATLALGRVPHAARLGALFVRGPVWRMAISHHERLRILDLLEQGKKPSHVARELGVNPSTVSRARRSAQLIRDWQESRGRDWLDPVPAGDPRKEAQAAQVRVEAAAPTPESVAHDAQVSEARELVQRHGSLPMFRSNPEVLAKLAELLADAIPPKWACRRVGISHSTWKGWIKRAQAGEPGYAEFLSVFRQCQAIGVEALLRSVRRGRQGWQSEAWILERTYPEDFAKREVQQEQEASPLASLAEEALRMVLQAKQEAEDARGRLVPVEQRLSKQEGCT